MSEWVLLAVGLVTGGAVAWLLATSKSSGTIAELRSQLSQLQTMLQAFVHPAFLKFRLIHGLLQSNLKNSKGLYIYFFWASKFYIYL